MKACAKILEHCPRESFAGAIQRMIINVRMHLQMTRLEQEVGYAFGEEKWTICFERGRENSCFANALSLYAIHNWQFTTSRNNTLFIIENSQLLVNLTSIKFIKIKLDYWHP